MTNSTIRKRKGISNKRKGRRASPKTRDLMKR
jgi:hypothetical protein